jgi:hypothetical protein
MKSARQTTKQPHTDWPEIVRNFEGIPDIEPFETSRFQNQSTTGLSAMPKHSPPTEN